MIHMITHNLSGFVTFRSPQLNSWKYLEESILEESFMKKLENPIISCNVFVFSPINQRAQYLPHIDFVVFADKSPVQLLKFDHTTTTILTNDHCTKIPMLHSVRVSTLVC